MLTRMYNIEQQGVHQPDSRRHPLYLCPLAEHKLCAVGQPQVRYRWPNRICDMKGQKGMQEGECWHREQKGVQGGTWRCRGMGVGVLKGGTYKHRKYMYMSEWWKGHTH